MLLKIEVAGGLSEMEAKKKMGNFRRVCTQIAKENKGKLIAVNDFFPCSFFEAEMEIFGKRYWIRLHKIYAWVAFTDEQTNDYGDKYEINASGWINSSPKYIDEPALKHVFSPYYRVLTSEELAEEMKVQRLGDEPEDIKILNENELGDAYNYNIGYWAPHNVGEVVFNMWD